MTLEVAGLGNALMDALVVIDDSLLVELGLTKGTMHLVDHEQWEQVFDRVRDRDVTFHSGGSCANTIATIGWLGGDALYCGQVGPDDLGRMYEDRIQRACGQHALIHAPSGNTGRCLSLISAVDAERTMLTHLGAAVSVEGLGAFEDHLKRTKIAQFTGYTLLDGPMRETAIDAMRIAKAAGAKVSIDAADPFVVLQIRDLLWELLTDLADIVFLNADEARKLTDEEPEQAIHTIAKRANIETVIVKLGGSGSLVLHQGELHRIAIRKVRAIDTTGAGDAYAGGFLFAHVRGWPARLCGELASAVAALAVAQVGAVVQDRELLTSLVAELDPGTAA